MPDLVAVDNMPTHIVGIFNYHGTLVPVMNLDSPLGHVSLRYRISDNIILFEWDGVVNGLIVDEAKDLLDIRPEELEAAPEIEADSACPLIAHRIPHEDGAVNVLYPLPLSEDREAIKSFAKALSEIKNEGQVPEGTHLILGMTLLEQSLLQERTQGLLELDQQDHSDFTQIVVIRMNEEYFGIDLNLVQECAECWGVTSIPGCPDFVRGVLNVRSEVLPIVDLRPKLHMPSGEIGNYHKAVVIQYENMSVGIVVEEIIESVFLRASDMVSGSLTVTATEEDGFIRGIGQFHDQKYLKVLDLQKILMDGELTVDQTFLYSNNEAQEAPMESIEGNVDPAVGEGSELQSIFMRESKESLKDLRDAITSLREMLKGNEEKPEGFVQAALQRAFNQSHFLMSVARMLGARNMEIVARRVEDLLRVAKRGRGGVTLEFIDYLDHCTKGVQLLFDQNTSGTAANIDPIRFLQEKAFDEGGLSAESQGGGSDRATAIRDYEGKLLVESTKLDHLMELINDLKDVVSGRQECLLDTSQLVKFSDTWSHRVFEQRAIGIRSNRSKHALVRDEIANFYNQENQQLNALTTVVGRVARTVADEQQRLGSISEMLEEHVRTMRLLAFSNFFHELPKLANDIAREFRKEVELSIEGDHMTVDKQVLQDLKEPLRQLIRNAIRHGIETPSERIEMGKPPKGALRLYAFQMGTYLLLELWDDGKGLNIDAIKQAAMAEQLHTPGELEKMSLPQIESLIFKPGLSTGSLRRGTSENGMGLDMVQSTVKRLKGAVYVGSTPDSGCMVQIQLPGPMPPVHLLIISVGGQRFGIPIDQVQTTTRISSKESAVKSREFVNDHGQVVPLASLADLLEIEGQPKEEDYCPCVVVAVDEKPLGCLVDEIVFEQEVRPQPQGLILKKVRNVSGSAILSSGEVCLILNLEDLMRGAEKRLALSRSA